jgi:hypothetical protein
MQSTRTLVFARRVSAVAALLACWMSVFSAVADAQGTGIVKGGINS